MGRLAFGISQSSNSGNNFESCFEVFFYFSKNLFFSNSWMNGGDHVTSWRNETQKQSEAEFPESFSLSFYFLSLSLSLSFFFFLSLVLSSAWSIFRRSCYAVVAIWTSPWWKFTQYFWPIKCLKKFLLAASINFFRFIAYGNVFDNSGNL